MRGMPTVNLSLGSRSYQVHVENNALDSVGYLTGRLRLSGKAAVISDSNVYPLYGEQVLQSLQDAGYSTSLHVFEAGEKSKNLSTVEQIVNEMVEAGHDRSSFVVLWAAAWWVIWPALSRPFITAASPSSRFPPL